MTIDEAKRKLDFMKKSYQKLIDEKVDSGKLVGDCVSGEWKAETPLDEAYKSMIDALEIAIKALEQEPCDDAISRQAVIDAIEDDNRNGHYSCFATNNDAQCFKDVIRKLPSVTPQPKMGRWIYTGDYITDGMLKCSKCGFEHDVSERFSYCPNCGANMQEEEE